MTLAEIRDQFNALYLIETLKRQVPKIPLGNKEIAFFISASQQDIQRRLAVVTVSQDIVMTGTNIYGLNSNFGNDLTAVCGGVTLARKSVKWLRELISSSMAGDYYAIYPSGNTQYLLTTVSSGTLTIYYHPDFNYYRPSLGGSEDWGTFDGITYSGKLLIPDRYDMAVLYRMLAFIFPDYLAMYEKELKSLRESRVGSTEDRLLYEFGDDLESEGETTLATSVTTTTTLPSTNADKFLRIRVTDAGAATVSEASGWTTNPTVVNSVSSIVVTSADSEFTNYTHCERTQNDWEWSQTGANTITITTHPSSVWGQAEILIQIWT